MAPNIIVVSIDNVQANHVGAYGYTRKPTTPNIDKLAKRGVVFEQAYSYFPRTRNVLSSLLLGRLLPGFAELEAPERFRETAITNLLSQRGYSVLVKGWFDSSGKFSPKGYGIDTWMRRATSAEQRNARRLPYIHMSERYADMRRHFKAARDQDRPVFSFMHFLKPHRFRKSFSPWKRADFGPSGVDKYDSAIAEADDYLPKIQALAGKYLDGKRDTIWIVMSDHWTGFHYKKPGYKRPHQAGRSTRQYHVHVPFIIAGGPIEPTRSKAVTSVSIDLAATVLDLAGVQIPADYDGVSLVPILEGEASPEAVQSRMIVLRHYDRTFAAVHQKYKLIRKGKSLALFDIEADPNESTNLVDDYAELANAMDTAMAVGIEGMDQAYEDKR
jgi:arylsulfatase A-like enzyme